MKKRNSIKEQDVPNEIYLVALANTATSAALYTSLIESDLSFIIWNERLAKQERV